MCMKHIPYIGCTLTFYCEERTLKSTPIVQLQGIDIPKSYCSIPVQLLLFNWLKSTPIVQEPSCNLLDLLLGLLQGGSWTSLTRTAAAGTKETFSAFLERTDGGLTTAAGGVDKPSSTYTVQRWSMPFLVGDNHQQQWLMILTGVFFTIFNRG